MRCTLLTNDSKTVPGLRLRMAHTEAGKIRGTCFGADFLMKKCVFIAPAQRLTARLRQVLPGTARLRQVPLWGNVFVLNIFLCVIIRFPVWLVKESLNEPRFGQLLQAVAAAIDARVLTRASLE